MTTMNATAQISKNIPTSKTSSSSNNMHKSGVSSEKNDSERITKDTISLSKASGINKKDDDSLVADGDEAHMADSVDIFSPESDKEQSEINDDAENQLSDSGNAEKEDDVNINETLWDLNQIENIKSIFGDGISGVIDVIDTEALKTAAKAAGKVVPALDIGVSGYWAAADTAAFAENYDDSSIPLKDRIIEGIHVGTDWLGYAGAIAQTGGVALSCAGPPAVAGVPIAVIGTVGCAVSAASDIAYYAYTNYPEAGEILSSLPPVVPGVPFANIGTISKVVSAAAELDYAVYNKINSFFQESRD